MLSSPPLSSSTDEADLSYAEQLSDMAALKAALQSFDADMKAMMLQMTQLSSALQRVGRSFAALTSLHFSSTDAKARATRLTSALVQLREGAAFVQHNARVHADVVQPVAALTCALHAARAAASWRDKSSASYAAARRDVDKTEQRCARAHRALDTCARYDDQRRRRDAAQRTLAAHDAAFQAAFRALLTRTDAVTAQTMRRYLQINARYLAAVVHALAQADDAVLHDDDDDDDDERQRSHDDVDGGSDGARAHATTAAKPCA